MSSARLKLSRSTLIDEPTSLAPSQVRSLTLSDVQAVGSLMYDAYLGAVDYSGETVEDAIKETRRTFEGAYGPFLSDASLGLFVEGQIQSAVSLRYLKTNRCLHSASHALRINDGAMVGA
jgi:hypothetical protein